jgi:enolase
MCCRRATHRQVQRAARYNQVLRIEQELGTQAKDAGRAALKALA